jgi:hypothetical protein
MLVLAWRGSLMFVFLFQDDTLKQQMNSFLLSTQSQNEIANLDSKVCIGGTTKRGVRLSVNDWGYDV